MARETKVGLLVGLAFIICFAIILANRGEPDRIAGQLPYYLLMNENPARPSDASSVQDPAVRRPGVLTEADVPLHTTTYAPPRISDGPSETDSGWGSPRRAGREGASPTWPTGASARDERAMQESLGTREIDSEPAADSRSVAHHPDFGRVTLSTTGGNLADPLERLREQARRLNEAVNPPSTPSHPDAVNSSPQAAESSAVQRARKEPAKYTVRSGDSLSRVAELAYKSQKRAVLEAIYQANKEVMPNIDTLKVGDVLTLPVIEGLPEPMGEGIERVAGSGTPGAGDRAATAPIREDRSAREGQVEQGFRWYQVKKSDRYANIAREQLGDERRWREIFELNKDKFPDPDRIREGVRIKLPPK